MKPKYEFHTAADILRLTKKHGISISELAKRYEVERSKKSDSAVRNKMKLTIEMMQEAVKKGVKSREKSPMGIVGGDARKLFNSTKKLSSMMGNRTTIKAMAYAMAVGERNACMGRIVAFPTAGGAGVIPGVLFSGSDQVKGKKRKLLRGFFAASAIGIVIAEGSTLSAAKGGCQAEVGAGVAMASAALTEMRGGTPEQCLHSAAIGLKSYLGLVCDPLGGLVEVPCVKRNAIGCMAAIGASDMAMSGIKSFIPFDEVVDAMKRVGDSMSPKLKETALGGLATTKTGKSVQEKLKMKHL